MSDTVQPPTDFPVPFAVYAAALRPQRVPLLRSGRQVIFKGRVVMTVTPGHVDEVWLKMLKIRHGSERHTPAEWAGLIDKYREDPAHPTDPRMVR